MSSFTRRIFFAVVLVGLIAGLACVSGFESKCLAKMPPSIEQSAAEPIKYVGGVVCDKAYYDGRLRYAIGTHSYEAFRANRTHAPEDGMIGWTYNHQPYLCYWNGKYYLQYLSNLKEEHVPPGRTLLMTSLDGRNWSDPVIVFPKYPLPDIKAHYEEVGNVDLPAGTFSVMHQRMGLYIAPNGKLLTLAFYSFCKTPRSGPNNGQGLGRVVREVKPDGTFGPIYFIRYNRHAGWNESNTLYPFYKESKDAEFVKACEDLLADKLATLQWWEEDRAKDYGFYTIDLGGEEIKALSYCHRPDGSVLGVWKHTLAALSPDEGQSWTKLVECRTLKTCGAKTWIQKTDDGKYALVYNHSATRRNRFPMVVMTSDDCRTFDNLLCLNGECPPMRYQGIHKNIGTQYIRGIAEGNGNPPGDHMWNVYSMNKEDIWITRTTLPIRGTVEKQISQDFENVANESELGLWNLYVPKWAPVSIVNDPTSKGNKCLEMRDEEPYDYAVAQRAFPEAKKVTVELRVYMAKVGHGVLDVEVQDKHGIRPMRVRFDPDWISMDRMKTEPHPVPAQPSKWYDIKLVLDCDEQEYDLYVDGKREEKGVEFAGKVESLERLVIRTGPWRGDVRPLIRDRGEPGTLGLYLEDMPGGDNKVPLSIYYIDDVKTR
jgi:hypothetical protein